MIKKTTVWLMALFMLPGIGSVINAQDENQDGPMWETIVLTPDNTKLKVLGENMRKHNQKYHNAEGPFKATVYAIASGPDVGKYVWLMGPLTFPDLDKRPAAAGHDEDWRDNVMPYVKKTEYGEYWKQENKYSNTGMLSNDPSLYPLQYVTYWEINDEHGHNLYRMLKQMSDAVKAMDGDNPWGVYENQFRQGKLGRHFASVGFYKNWTDFDRDPMFKKAYIKLNGEDSWDAFIRDMDQLMDNSWDEIWSYDKYLSGE